MTSTAILLTNCGEKQQAFIMETLIPMGFQPGGILTPTDARDLIEGEDGGGQWAAYRLDWQQPAGAPAQAEPHVKVYLVEMLMHQLENITVAQERITGALLDALQHAEDGRDMHGSLAELITEMNNSALLHQALLKSMGDVTSNEEDEPCDLSEAARLAGGLYAAVLLKGRITLNISVEPNLKPDIPANVAILVLCNLVSNASDAIGHEGGNIRIEARDAGDTIKCTVMDDGCGIAPEIVARIFEHGFTTKGARRGRGLTLSARVLEKSRAQIEVTSSGPTGTTFTIYLPKRHSICPNSTEEVEV